MLKKQKTTNHHRSKEVPQSLVKQASHGDAPRENSARNTMRATLAICLAFIAADAQGYCSCHTQCSIDGFSDFMRCIQPCTGPPGSGASKLYEQCINAKNQCSGDLKVVCEETATSVRWKVSPDHSGLLALLKIAGYGAACGLVAYGFSMALFHFTLLLRMACAKPAALLAAAGQTQSEQPQAMSVPVYVFPVPRGAVICDAATNADKIIFPRADRRASPRPRSLS